MNKRHLIRSLACLALAFTAQLAFATDPPPPGDCDVIVPDKCAPELVATFEKACPRGGGNKSCRVPSFISPADVFCDGLGGQIWCEAHPQVEELSKDPNVYTYSWTLTGFGVPPSGSSPNSPLASGTCTGNVHVTVTVTNVNTGATTSDTTTVFCNGQ